MAIQIGGTTVIDNSRSLQNITGGAILGIQSAGTVVGSGATVLNFIGAGNTFAYNAGTKTLDISISGGGGGGGGSLGVSSSTNRIGFGITDLTFVGAGVTAVGLTTAVVTVNKTLTIGRRSETAAVVNLVGSNLPLLLRNGSTITVTT